MRNFKLPGFLHYNNHMYSVDGQPYFSRFVEVKGPARTYLDREAMIARTNGT